ncbi:hypothetical protein niasHT_002427 [Heterodera trifolii]|uniref:B30.2/SPRY domain-containing protein n=1 Tax=Heterodera trifolii TaxID=157864 RepID=A0ABD2LMF8_9BILA
MSSFTTSSSADEFSPLQPIFPNLSPSEEMSVLIARIAELYRAKTIEPSVASSEVFGQDGYGMNDDGFSLDEEEEEDEQQEDRKTPTKDVLEDHLKAILERIVEIEKQQQQQTKAFLESQNDQKKILEKISETEKQQQQQTKAFLESQNDQKKILEKISEMEKQTKKKVLLKFQENCWDSFACHNELKIIGDKCLIVHHKGPTGWRCSVFAKYPIVLNKRLSDFFYYEISVMKKEKNFESIIFGFAVKQQTKLDGSIHYEKGTYAFESNGEIWINGERNGTNAEYSYGVGDTVGIGVNSATRQIIFTKNGLRLDTSDFLVDPSFADGSFYPFVTLFGSGDKIEANFGPNFKFDLETL